MWKMRDQWYCVTPGARPCSAAEQLNTTTTFINAKDFTQGIGQGVFTNEQKAAHRAYLKTASSREAVLHKVVNAASRGSMGGSIGLPLSPRDVSLLVDQVSGSADPWYIRGLGKYWYLFVGLFLMITFTKISLDCTIRAYVLYLERGCGCWMFAALWGTMFAVLRIPGALISNTITAVTTPANDQLVAPWPLQPNSRSSQAIQEDLLASERLDYQLREKLEELEQFGEVDQDIRSGGGAPQGAATGPSSFTGTTRRPTAPS
jgi:hypothetical protein